MLEVFILEYTLSKGKLETAVEAKIKEMGLGEGQWVPVYAFILILDLI